MQQKKPQIILPDTEPKKKLKKTKAKVEIKAQIIKEKSFCSRTQKFLN